MKKDWQTKKLGDLCEIELGKTPARANKSFWDEKRETSNVWLSIADLLNAKNNIIVESKEYLSDKGAAISKTVCEGTLLASFKLTLGRLAFAGRDLFTNEAIAALNIFNKHELSKEFLFYFLHFFDWRKAAENDVKLKGMTLNKAKLKELPVHFPSLHEQKRIVGILDKAFAAISTAKENAEKNLANSRELFESYLQSVDAEKESLGTLVDIVTGKLDANAATENGQYPFFTCSREIFAIDKFAFDCEAILLAGNNAVGDFNVKHYKGKFNAYQRTYVITVNKEGKVLYRYLYFQMLKSLKEFKAKSVGAGTKFLKLGMIKDLKIALPTLSEQHSIVAKLDALSEETKKLENIYQQKIADLDELKKSILQKAFTGQLTAGESIQPVSVAIPFPQTMPNINTTKLHAGILAMAYQLHEKNSKMEYFTHVKAEKIAHMIEAFAEIDLGRRPVKDAAGPNDFPHLIKVEHHARMTYCFDFKQTPGGAYRVCKLNGFEKLIEKTRTALGDQLSKVEHVLDLMLPLNVQHAEIVATVFAAWNNLLLDGKQPTDEDIVFEARENWHPDKLKIERENFFKTIIWMTKKNIIPNGKGKRVVEKAI